MSSSPYLPRKPWSRRFTRCAPVFVKNAETGEAKHLADVFVGCGLKVLTSVHLATWKGEPRWQYQVSVSVLGAPQVSRRTQHALAVAAMVGGMPAVKKAIEFRPHEERRPTDDEISLVLREFKMLGAEEDNHEPGRARHFWMLCELRTGEIVGECECKTTEEVVVEPDGHTWSRVTHPEKDT